MPKGLIFFCCACCILLFTIINLSVGPIISLTVRYSWRNLNCAQLVDAYDIDKKGNIDEQDKYDYEWEINECKRKKGMHDMEYTAFIFDIVIGFVCGLLGLLHLFNIGNDFAQKTGIIGLGCGIVGFILTFVYVILNGIVYTNYYDTVIYKRDSEGAFAELDGNRFKCIYFDFDEPKNHYALYAKYCDLIQKQYNYDKDFNYEKPSEWTSCPGVPSDCKSNGYISGPSTCKKLYVDSSTSSIENKDKSNRFLTALLLSLFVCLANIGLAIFGFMLFRTQGGFTKVIEVKN